MVPFASKVLTANAITSFILIAALRAPIPRSNIISIPYLPIEPCPIKPVYELHYLPLFCIIKWLQLLFIIYHTKAMSIKTNKINRLSEDNFENNPGNNSSSVFEKNGKTCQSQNSTYLNYMI